MPRNSHGRLCRSIRSSSKPVFQVEPLKLWRARAKWTLCRYVDILNNGNPVFEQIPRSGSATKFHFFSVRFETRTGRKPSSYTPLNPLLRFSSRPRRLLAASENAEKAP